MNFNQLSNQQHNFELKVNVKSIQETLTFQIPNKQMFEDLCPKWKDQNQIDIEEITDLIGIYNFFNSIIILIINEFSEPQNNFLDDTVAKLSLQSGYCSQMIPQLLEYNDTKKLLKLYTNIDHSLSQKDISNIENYLSSNYSKLLDDPQSDLISIDVQYHHRILSNALKQNNFPYSQFAQFIKKHIKNKPEIVVLLSQLCISNINETDVASFKQIDNVFAYFNHSDLYRLYKENKKLQSENEKLKKENEQLQNQQNNEILLNLQNLNAKMNNQEISIQNLKNGFDSLQQTQINNVNAINQHFSDSNNQISQLTEKFTEIKKIGQEIQNSQVNQTHFDQRTNQIINEINQTAMKENEKIQNFNQQNNNILKNIEKKLDNCQASINENNNKKSENIIQEIQNMRYNLRADVQGSRDEILSHVDYVDKFPHQIPNQFKGILNKLKQINSIEIRHAAEIFENYKATNLIDYSNENLF